MNEPADLTAWVDRHGDTWVRVDEVGSEWNGPWRCLCDGPGWDRPGHPGGCRDWNFVSDYGPFIQADPQRTAAAIARIRQLESAT